MKYLQVNEHGEILSVSEPVEGFEYTAGPDEIVYVGDLDLTTSYYNAETGMVEYRTPSPGIFYSWENLSWVFKTETFNTHLREERDQRLAASDWTQMPDSPLTTEQKAAWATYRQALRDLPANLTGSENTLENAPWPTPPSEGS